MISSRQRRASRVHPNNTSVNRIMGHQVNFFLTPADMSSLVKQLRSLGELLILSGRSHEAAPKIVDDVNYVDRDGNRWGCCLAQPDLLSQVVMRHVPAQHYWSVHESVSPVIELSQCFFDDRILREGRIYYNDGFYGPDDQWQNKPAAFRSWAKSIFAKTRRSARAPQPMVHWPRRRAMAREWAWSAHDGVSSGRAVSRRHWRSGEAARNHAPGGRGVARRSSTPEPEARAQCGSTARWDPCGGRSELADDEGPSLPRPRTGARVRAGTR
jgi:hypothetical protein